MLKLGILTFVLRVCASFYSCFFPYKMVSGTDPVLTYQGRQLWWPLSPQPNWGWKNTLSSSSWQHHAAEMHKQRTSTLTSSHSAPLKKVKQQIRNMFSFIHLKIRQLVQIHPPHCHVRANRQSQGQLLPCQCRQCGLCAPATWPLTQALLANQRPRVWKDLKLTGDSHLVCLEALQPL